MRSLYLSPERFPATWSDPVPLAVSALLAELICYLEDECLDVARRDRAEALLGDLLKPVPMVAIEIRMPTEQRAARVAARLLAYPSDRRSLAEWGGEVGTSGRTLSRAFLTERRAQARSFRAG
jgi:hypothetical protein